MRSEVNAPIFIHEGNNHFSAIAKVIDGVRAESTHPFSHLKKAQSRGFAQRKMIDLRKRFDLSVTERFADIQREIILMDKVFGAFGDMMTAYDKESVWPNVCISGIKAPSTDLDQLGHVGRDRDRTYSPELLAEVAANYKRYKKVSKDHSISMPRGRNACYPFLVSGANRIASDLFLAIQAALAQGAHRRNWSLADLQRFLESYHGPAFQLQSERYQDKGKLLQIHPVEGDFVSKAVFKWARMIFLSPKHAVMFWRPLIKDGLETLLNTPMHTQDRGQILKWVQEQQKKKWTMMAVDAKRYDQQMRVSILEQMFVPFSQLTGCSKEQWQDFVTELRTPLLLMSRQGLFWDDTGPILSSGAGPTTLFGCLGSDLEVLDGFATFMKKSPSAANAARGISWDYKGWGDDLMVAWDPSLGTSQQLLDSFKKNNFEVEQEPMIKYLGFIYARADGKPAERVGYSVASMISRQDFPERKKIYPFTTIGYLGRLEALPDDIRAEYHKRRARFWSPDMGPYFQYQERHKILQSLLQEAEKHSAQIGQLDDILAFLTHGLGAEYLDVIGVDDEDDIWSQLLGVQQADVTDPMKFISEVLPDYAKHVQPMVAKILKGDFSAYVPLLHAVTAQGNFFWRNGDVLY